jgi:trypsin
MRVVACLVLAACAAPVSTSTQAVTNGSDDASDPAVVALVDDQGNVGCTASVIEAHTVLTAAHCIAAVAPRKIRVWLGGSAYSQVTGGRAHPMFDPATFANDVAVLTFFDAASVAPLVRETAAPSVGDVIRVVGFGTTSAMASDSTTKRAGSAMISEVDPDAFTVRPAPSQPCHGDSGGPALTAAGTIAGVVSNGDSGCSDHAVYARVDVASAFIGQYLTDTAPGTASVGDACLYDGQCADGPCLVASDDAELAFCGKPCAGDGACPDAMMCDDGECRYPLPSPGALGSTCTTDADCTSGTCLDGLCTRSCGPAAACPADFQCGGAREGYCYAAEGGGCGGCASGGAPGLVIAFLAFARARRTRRRA